MAPYHVSIHAEGNIRIHLRGEERKEKVRENNAEKR